MTYVAFLITQLELAICPRFIECELCKENNFCIPTFQIIANFSVKNSLKASNIYTYLEEF
jgi:hypothetical protein